MTGVPISRRFWGASPRSLRPLRGAREAVSVSPEEGEEGGRPRVFARAVPCGGREDRGDPGRYGTDGGSI